MHPQEFAARLKTNRRTAEMLLAAHGVSRTEIAQLSGQPIWTVSRVLRNFRYVDPEKRIAVLRAVASRVGCDIEELVLGRLAA